VSRDIEDEVYDRMAAACRQGCCGDRRKPCVEHAMFIDGAEMALMASEVQAAFRDAARLRSLAATFDSHLNRDKTYTGAQVAAMLRDGEG